MTTILTVYFSDSLGLGDKLGEALTSAFLLGTYALALLGGIVADVFLGPFRVLCTGSFIMLIGALVLCLSELYQRYDFDLHLPLSFVGICLFYLGNGFMKPCLSAFMGDQFLETEGELRKTWFSWFYWSIQFGSLFFSIATPFTLQLLPSWITFVIILCPLLMGFSVFVIPHTEYFKRPKKEGNVFANFIKILVFGCFGERYESDEHWLDKSTRKYSHDSVEEAKEALKVLKVMIPLPFFWMIFFQMYSIWVEQAKAMDPMVAGYSVPPAVTSSLNGLIDMLFIPLFEKLIYPFFERPSIKERFEFTNLKRMGVGHIFTIAALCVAGVVSRINATSQLSVLWIIPQYVLISCAEILLSISGLEFAYQEAPPSMKGTMTAVYLSTTAVGNLFIFALALINIPLQYEDFALAGIIVLVFGLFTLIARSYQYRTEHKNINIQEENETSE
uniref:Major facilitator superfamily (MFS) profile domain-containing protein n=1 Tax=Arcella intermedia TaxID=1963864 RepID=A0A6B2L426_9EUKA